MEKEDTDEEKYGGYIDFTGFNEDVDVTKKPCEFQGLGDLCKQYAYRENENKKFRKYMEDYCFYNIDILESEENKKSFYGVMDGHGGKSAAILASTELPNEFKKMWKEGICDVEDWQLKTNHYKTESFFKRLFINVDRTMAKQKIFDNGCTVCTVLLEWIND
jgi:serine/threonine protein phosphatase PrpC